jgi:hypothetical protein
VSDVVFRSGDIEVTRTLVRGGNASYPIANIGSIAIGSTPATSGFGCGAVLIGVGVLSLIAAVVNPTAGQDKGVILIFAFGMCGSGWLLMRRKTPAKYTLIIRTSSGDQNVLVSEDLKRIEEIKAAIEAAIAVRMPAS